MEIRIDFAQPRGIRIGNKFVHASGIDLVDNGTEIEVYTLNFKDRQRTTRFRLPIPKENIDDLINALNQLR